MVIAIEGLPGAGKSTSAELVAQRLGVRVMRETTNDHPFLKSVYDDADRDDLIVELAFLLLHAAAFRRLPADELTVTDYSPVKDDLFAVDMLDSDDLATFQRTYADLYDDPRPDVVVYLRVAPDLCLERVRRRMRLDPGRAFEAGMTLDRLERMRRLYDAQLPRLGHEVLTLDVDASMDEDHVTGRIVEMLRAHVAALAG